MGDADMAKKDSPVKPLQRAQAQVVVPPVSEQIIDTRVHRAGDEEIGCRDEGLEALTQGEKRLEELQSRRFVADAETELVRLRAQVADLQGSMRGVERRGSLQRRCPV